MTLTDIIPELNNGIENLTNALIDFGGQQFQLQNSDIFSTYIQNRGTWGLLSTAAIQILWPRHFEQLFRRYFPN